MKKQKDTDLREALRRNYAETPQLPEGFMERMHEAVEQEESQPRRTRSYRLVAAITSIAAAVILTFLLWPKKNTPLPTSPIVAGIGHPQERPKAETKTQLPQVELTEGQAMMAVAKQQPAPASTPPSTVATRPSKARKHIAKAVIPAESLPQVQTQVQCLSNEGCMADDDAKAQLYSAEIELEQAVHQHQASYEAEMMLRSLELLIYIMEPKDEELPAGGVKTQKS